MATKGTTITKKTQKLSDPKAKMTKLEREKAEAIEDKVNREEIMLTGQEDRKKGMAAVKMFEDARRAEAKRKEVDQLNKLDMKRGKGWGYKQELASSLVKLLNLVDFDDGWVADVVVTDGSPINIYGKPFQSKDGILLVVKTPSGEVMHQGVRCTNDPVLDLAAMQTLAIQTENTVDHYKKLLLGQRDVAPKIEIARK